MSTMIEYSHCNHLIAVARGEARDHDHYVGDLIADLRAEPGSPDCRYYIDGSGVMRWTSNHRVPPLDITELAHFLGALTDVQFKASVAARDEETTAALARYMEQRSAFAPDAEELFEMRAAFGAGETVVDIITGQEFKT